VDDVKVRERLREAFRTFSLPRMMPGAIPVPKPEGFEAITIDGGRGRRVLARRLRFSREHEIIHAGRCDRCCRAVVKDDVLVREGGERVSARGAAGVTWELSARSSLPGWRSRRRCDVCNQPLESLAIHRALDGSAPVVFGRRRR
jgi:hypothetical protein